MKANEVKRINEASIKVAKAEGDKFSAVSDYIGKRPIETCIENIRQWKEERKAVLKAGGSSCKGDSVYQRVVLLEKAVMMRRKRATDKSTKAGVKTKKPDPVTVETTPSKAQENGYRECDAEAVVLNLVTNVAKAQKLSQKEVQELLEKVALRVSKIEF